MTFHSLLRTEISSFYEFQKQTVDKLCRWASKLLGFFSLYNWASPLRRQSLAKPFIPRPLGQALPGTPPKQCLHHDFLYIQKRLKTSNQPFEYVVVLKDDFSGFVELIPATAADHFVVADALVQWYSRVGMRLMHLIDQGSHFKDEVIKAFNGTCKSSTIWRQPTHPGPMEQLTRSVTTFRILQGPFVRMENEIFPMTTSTSVSLESFVFSVSRKLCPSKHHDRAGRVESALYSIWSWCKQNVGSPYVTGKIGKYMKDRAEEISGWNPQESWNFVEQL